MNETNKNAFWDFWDFSIVKIISLIVETDRHSFIKRVNVVLLWAEKHKNAYKLNESRSRSVSLFRGVSFISC